MREHESGVDLSSDIVEQTQDIFLGGRLVIRQPRRGYRAGTDAVLLAATVSELAEGTRVLDAGAGVGTVGLCVAARCPGAQVVLVERESVLADLARQNARDNGFQARVHMVTADIGRASAALAQAGVASESFDHVLANPPFHDAGAGTCAGSELKAVSHQMEAGELATWARFLTRMAAPGGVATMIHKADALARLLNVLEGRFGAITVRPVYAREGEPAIRVIVTGIKGSRAPMRVASPLILHSSGQAFRPEIEAVFRAGAALPT